MSDISAETIRRYNFRARFLRENVDERGEKEIQICFEEEQRNEGASQTNGHLQHQEAIAMEPKVSKSFDCRPDQTPRRIDVERKRRLFAGQNVADILTNFGVPVDGMNTIIPLQYFDDATYECRTTIEWLNMDTPIIHIFKKLPCKCFIHGPISLSLNSNLDSHVPCTHGNAGKACFLPATIPVPCDVFSEKIGCWKSGFMVGYVPATFSWRISMGPDNTTPSFIDACRMHVHFLAEDAQLFCSRIIRALELNREAVSLLVNTSSRIIGLKML
jgi:dynein heavy chain